jgi:hypothetical protein
VTDAVPRSEHDLSAGTGLMAHGRPAGARAEGGNGTAPGAELSPGNAVPLRLPADVGLAVIAGLADDVRIGPAGQGTSVTMIWKRRTAAL